MQKNLCNSKKSSTFAAEFRNDLVSTFIFYRQERGGERICDLVAEHEGEMGEWLKPAVC